ncbi:MAG: AAA family ATPase [Nostoc sp.]
MKEYPYTISTVDSTEYKQLVCGRTNDIANLLNYIYNGRSLALFGERRIGKTSLLYLVRDIINQEINTYSTQLIDLSLKNAISDLQSKRYSYKAIYLNLQALIETKSDFIVQLLMSEIQDNQSIKNLYISIQNSQVSTLAGVFKNINNALLEDERLVVLIDEIESLQDFTDSKQVFRNFRDLIQSCHRICFVFAGAEAWHKQLKDKSAPLLHNVQSFYLRVPESFPVETYLIKGLLKRNLSPTCDIDQVNKSVIEWTGNKPYYVQAVCLAICEVCTRDGQLPKDWKVIVEKKVEESVEAALNGFYGADKSEPVAPKSLSHKILILLAKKPGLTYKDIAHKLGYSQREVWDNIDDLKDLDAVKENNAKYQIVGTFIEQWGKKTQDIPPVKNSWLQLIKWISAIIILLLALWIYFYTNPPLQTFQWTIPNGELYLRIPSSVEQGETGKVILLVKNTSQKNINLLNVILRSNRIDYRHKDGSNSVKVDSVIPGATWASDYTFTAQKFGSELSLTSQVLINPKPANSQNMYFNISSRVLPIKKYGGLISLLLVTLGGFFAKPDLIQLAISVFSGLLKPGSENKS